MKQIIDFSQYAPKEGEVLILKSLPSDLRAHGGFKWPESGYVEAPDWSQKPECGGGLHGWLWGSGDADLRCTDDDAKWMVLSTDSAGIVDLNGKIKFKSCTVVFCGERDTAISIISHFAPAGTPVIFGTATAGYGGTATAGYGGTATAGDGGTATAGYEGTATAGLYGLVVIEYYDPSKEVYLKKIAFIDGVEYLPGVKYRLNNNNEIEAVNDNS